MNILKKYLALAITKVVNYFDELIILCKEIKFYQIKV